MAKSDYRQLSWNICDLKNLKQTWDMASAIHYTFSEWKSTLWDKIDTDVLTARVKDIAQTVKLLPKEVKSSDVFRTLSANVRKMQVILPLINDLHSEFMKERHWKHLMSITGKTFSKDNQFSLNDILQLDLHEHVDDVSEIVEQAQKEVWSQKHHVFFFNML